MDEQYLGSIRPYRLLHILEAMGIRDVEFSQAGPPQGSQVGAASFLLAHFMGDRTHVGSGRDSGAEPGASSLLHVRAGASYPFLRAVQNLDDFEFLDLHPYRLQPHLLPLAGQLVSWNSMNLLGGKRRRHLFDDTNIACRDLSQFFK